MKATAVAGLAVSKDRATVLHTGQRVDRSTHDLMARFAFYMGDQAETTVVPLLGFIVQHYVNLPRLCETLTPIASGLIHRGLSAISRTLAVR
ncbi:hypothetical protein SRABI106_03310 [Rahnella aquatilis]|nr:hypothetical protein SRABI106_03310 [Rahnella aquatilis]